MFRKILKYAYFILCISVLFAVEQKVWTIKLETPTEWIIPFFNIALFIYAWRNRSTLNIKKTYLFAFILLALAIFISVLNSEIKTYSVKGAILWINYVFAFVGGFWILNFDNTEKQQFILVCTAAYSILLLYTFFHYVYIGIEYHNSYKMALPFANGHTLLIAMAFPLWIYLLNYAIKTKNKYATLFILFYTLVLYLSFSRFYWIIATLIAGIIFLFHYPKWIKATVITSIIVCFCAYIAYIKISEYRNKRQVWLDPKDHTSIFVQIESIFVMSKNESNMERFNRWHASKRMFSENIWTGVGINTFPELYYTYLDKINSVKTTRKEDYMNAHNLYIGTMAEQGIVGMLSVLFFIGIWAYHWKKLTFIAKLIVIHYLLLGIIEDFTLLTDIIPCFWICVAWGMKDVQHHE